MSEKEIQRAIVLLNLLIEYGIPAGQALYRAISALFGSDLSEEEIAQKIGAMENDARIRAAVAHADANGG